MALAPIQPVQEEKKGGIGGFFKKIGGLAGQVLGGGAGFLVGGPAGAAVGASLGGTLGGTASSLLPGGGGGGQAPGPNLIGSAVKSDPSLQIGAITQGKEALKEVPGLSMDQFTDANNKLTEYQNMIKKKWGI